MPVLVIMASFGKHGLARSEPIDRNLIFRISLARMRVGIQAAPSDPGGPTMKLSLLDRPPRGWFALDVIKDTRKCDWIALMVDVDPAQLRSCVCDFPARFHHDIAADLNSSSGLASSRRC
jgi:hypothetical protein